MSRSSPAGPHHRAPACAPRVAAVGADLDVPEECWEEGHRVLLSGLGETRDALAGTRAATAAAPAAGARPRECADEPRIHRDAFGGSSRFERCLQRLRQAEG